MIKRECARRAASPSRVLRTRELLRGQKCSLTAAKIMTASKQVDSSTYWRCQRAGSSGTSDGSGWSRGMATEGGERGYWAGGR
jgi:hypothetical protein